MLNYVYHVCLCNIVNVVGTYTLRDHTYVVQIILVSVVQSYYDHKYNHNAIIYVQLNCKHLPF